MREMDEWHCQHNPQYARLYRDHPRPAVPVGLFKSLDLATPVPEPGQWLSSSGTGQGGQTRVFFDQRSLGRIQRAMSQMFASNGFFTQTPSRFLLLSPDPRQGKHAGYATAFLKFTACAPVVECVFAVDGDGRFDGDLAWNTLRRWASDSSPVYLFGLTLFFERLLLCGQAPVAMLPELRGIMGGGWKGMTQSMTQPQIVAGLSGLLRAPFFDVRDIFGMTEHPLHYLSCRHGHFHVPVYSRVSVVAADGQAAPEGVNGLIRLENPFFASLPSHRLLTEDMGSWGQGCPCGLPGIYLRYVGRASSPQGTCAAQVA
jgi:hypothetical protein